MKRAVRLFLSDIIDNLKLTESLVEGFDYISFVKDRRTHNAVLRCIEVIGEATKNIPGDIRDKYPSVPWKELAGMRDVIIHFYMGVDFEIVWDVIKNRYPDLLPIIEDIYTKTDSFTL
jgi:uncharacterized protein with HEPN domain